MHKASRKEKGDNFKAAKRRLSRESWESSERTPKFSWQYSPGQLVEIKGSAFKYHKNSLEYLNLYPGAVGVIVEVEDNRVQSNRYLNVMGPSGLQTWHASWVKFCEE